MTYTAIYPLRANGKVYGVGESIPSTLKEVNYDSLVSKGFISKLSEKEIATTKTPSPPKPGVKKSVTTEK